MKIEDLDFNEMYISEKMKSSFKAKNKDAWNKKAPSMNKNVHKSIYNKQLLNLIDITNCDSLLDVGCGVGNLSLLLAEKINKITALDFSSKMLEILQKNAEEKNIKNIKTVNASWYDSWDNISKADLVLASRCMEVKDMKAALNKLNDKAKKRVVLSYKVGGSFVNENILKAIKKEVNNKPDYIYLLNILYNMGINASLNFVRSEGRNSSYEDFNSFKKSIIWSVGELDENELKALNIYYYKEVKNKEVLDDYVKWAIISWDKK